MILAMNAPGLAALASEVATAEDETMLVKQEEVMPDVETGVGSAPDAAVAAEPNVLLDWLPPEAEVTDSEEVEPVTVEAVPALQARPAAVAAPAIVPLAVYPYADVGTVKLQGFGLGSPYGWTNGNVTGYHEGEWMEFRLEINNTAGNAVTVQVPSTVYTVDFKNGGAVAVDATANWRWEVSDGSSGTFTPLSHDVPSAGEDVIRTALPEAPGFILDKGEMGYILFEAHLALTPYWMPSEGLYGASGYPGSSAHARLVEWNGEGIGDKASPFVVGEKLIPEGSISGLKFEDLNGNGIQDAGEGPLEGWVFDLEYLDLTYGFSLTETSAADGTFEFTSIPSGDYALTERSQAGWTLTTDLDDPITVEGAAVGPIKVGNAPDTVDKTWRLTLTAPMAVDSYFVKYVIGSETTTRAITPGVDSTMQVPWGTTITSWQFFAMLGAEEIPLSGVLGPAERLVEDQTNPFTFTPGQISGHKWIAGDPPTAGVGWTIKLYRNDVLFASTTTGADGAYSFTGLPPGTYKVEEVEQTNYMKVVPVGDFLGPFTVVSGSVFNEGTDFTNAPRPTGIVVTKTADPTLVHVGDEITYTIDVENVGQVDVNLTSVTDAKFNGGANLLAAPVILVPGQSLSDLGLQIVLYMDAPDATMVDNTALATGTTVFGPVSDDDDAHVDILRPAIDVTKTVVEDNVLDSDDVTYYVTVTNTGETTLTISVIDYVDSLEHKVLDTALVLGPGEHKDYEWDETVSMPVEDTVVAIGVDELGGEKGTVSDEASAAVAVDVTKTFSLTYVDAPVDAQFFVIYQLMEGDPVRVDLTGSGPYIGSDEIPWGSTITGVWWMATYHGHDYLLGMEEMEETLEGPVLNEFTYSASASGHKFEDIDRSSTWDEPDEKGLAGWTIGLYRALPANGVDAMALPSPDLGFELFAATVTDADGSYSFTGLLPGVYYVAEDLQEGWDQIVAPEGTFLVFNGAEVEDLDFGNAESFLPFTDTELEKVADKTKANPGDLVTYTLTYRNIGDGTIDEVTIVDDYDERYMVPVDIAGATQGVGTLTWVDTVPLGPGDERTITYTMRVILDMPVNKTTNVDNVAVITPGGHQADWRVEVDNPFLPFTGATLALLALVAAGALLIGVAIRRKAHDV